MDTTKIVKKIIPIITVILIILLIIFFANLGKENSGIKKVSFTNEEDKSIEIDVEIADDAEERTNGLMKREKLAENTGMLFIFSGENSRSFWMKNMLISLDIIFLDANRNIVSIANDARPCNNDFCNSYDSGGKAKYVIEVNAGFCEKNGIKTDTKVEFY